MLKIGVSNRRGMQSREEARTRSSGHRKALLSANNEETSTELRNILFDFKLVIRVMVPRPALPHRVHAGPTFSGAGCSVASQGSPTVVTHSGHSMGHNARLCHRVSHVSATLRLQLQGRSAVEATMSSLATPRHGGPFDGAVVGAPGQGTRPANGRPRTATETGPTHHLSPFLFGSAQRLSNSMS